MAPAEPESSINDYPSAVSELTAGVAEFSTCESGSVDINNTLQVDPDYASIQINSYDGDLGYSYDMGEVSNAEIPEEIKFVVNDSEEPGRSESYVFFNADNVLNKRNHECNVSQSVIGTPNKMGVVSAHLIRQANELNYEVIPTLGDGHCFFHAIVNSYLAQHGVSLESTDVISACVQELEDNLLVYSNQLMMDELHIRQLANAYITQKGWNNEFCDLAPYMVANAMKIRISIHSKHADIERTIVIEPRIINGNEKIIHIYKDGDHYNGVRIT